MVAEPKAVGDSKIAHHLITQSQGMEAVAVSEPQDTSMFPETQAEKSSATLNPYFGRRAWVKLWVNEWLDGTTRFEMSDAQRAFWIDLLAMAGRSRYPGIVCAGKNAQGELVGYPINKYQSLMSEPINIEETFALFVRTGKIRIEVTATSPVQLLAVELLNWHRYQSEYQRQKKYRHPELQRGDSQSYSQGNTIEEEVEVEVEGEGKKNKNKRSKPSVIAGFPAWISPEAWRGFVEMRNKKKKPLTDRAVFLAIKKLEQLKAAGNSPEEVLNQSTLNCWTGLFEIKDRQAGGRDRSSYTQRRNERTKEALDKAFGKREGARGPAR